MNREDGFQSRELDLAVPEATVGEATVREADIGVTTPLRPVNSRRQLSSEELAALKPIIKQLYIDNGLTFQELQKVLESQYNYNPTQKQFSDLRRKWGMKKNTRLGDRQRILNTLDSGGTSEEGHIDTVSLNLEKVKKWRKEAKNGTVVVHRSAPKHKDTTSSTSSSHSVKGPRRLAPRHRLIQQPTAPKVFQETEGLLFYIKVYIGGMYDQKIWLPVDTSRFASQEYKSNTVGVLDSSSLDKFFGLCMNAIDLLKTQSFVEARKLLSSACSLIYGIIKFGHPDTLRLFLETFLFFINEHGIFFDDALNIVRNYIGRMAMAILPKDHPWRAICGLLGTINKDQLDQSVLLSFQTLSNVLETKLGRLNNTTIKSRATHLFYAHLHNLRDGELALRELLSECQDPCVEQKDRFLVMKYLTSNLTRQGQFQEIEYLGEDYVAQAEQSGSYMDLVMGYQMLSRGQHGLGKQAPAEASLRKVVDIFLGQNDPDSLSWAIRFLTTLESWVRGWGRIADADKLKSEISDLIESNVADEEELLA